MRYTLNIIAAAGIVLSSGTNALTQAMIEQSNPIVKQAVPEAGAAKGVSKKPKPAVTLAGNWKLTFQDEFHGTEADLDANWEFQNGPSGHILCSRWCDNAKLDNGILRLVGKKEKRGGQDWTAASGWTRKQFKYGYFECRYRYLPTTGTNNSFWIMTRLPKESSGRFEIDINEGHYPNEVNMNLHNWSGKHWARGSRWYYGKGPGQSQIDAGFEFVLSKPITTSRLRLRSREMMVRIMEFRAFAPSTIGYPSVFPNRIEAQPDVENLCTTATAAASSELESRYAASRAIDGKLGTDSRWVSGRDSGAELLVSFPKQRQVGCLQFISGWQKDDAWLDVVSDFDIDYWDGAKWQPVPGASRKTLDDQAKESGAPPNLGETFHVYSLLWTEKELVHYFDGKPIYRTNNDICHKPAPVWLSLAIMKWAGPVTDAIDGKSMDIDYVRIWQREQ